MNEEKFLFSVIIPTFNRQDFIEEALGTVKDQTYRPIEVVIVDDGSTDKTREVVQEWINENEEEGNFSLHYVYKKNAGVGAARNFGIQIIHGDFVQFLDSDDRLYPERLQQLVQLFIKEQCDFIQTGFEGFNADTGEIIQVIYGNPQEHQLELALKGKLWANTLRSAFTTKLVKSIAPWRTDMPCFEDREYVQRAVVHSQKTEIIRDVLASARRGGGPHLSDKSHTYEGCDWLIYCEYCLAEATLNREDISIEAKQAFASRIYLLGIQLNARNWLDLGKKCEDLAKRVDVSLDTVGRIYRLLWSFGWWGGKIYDVARGIKRYSPIFFLR